MKGDRLAFSAALAVIVIVLCTVTLPANTAIASAAPPASSGEPIQTGALGIAFWHGRPALAIISSGSSTVGVCDSGAWLRQYPPFQPLSATANCQQVAKYVAGVVRRARKGAPINAVLKGQVLATALDVFFSTDGLGGNQIGAPAPIGPVLIDLTQVCQMVDASDGTASCNGTYEDATGAFGHEPGLAVSDMLAAAAGQSNAGGSTWYGNVAATEQLAKDAFDAVNNQAALSGMPDLSAIAVASSPDVDHGVTATVGALGGTLHTVGADGTDYQLIVPPGALDADTDLSMTPTDVSGLDSIATAARFGVEFGPSGLAFAQPATLVVHPPAGAAPSDTDLAASFEGGSGIEMQPLGHAADGALVLAVPHFSGEVTVSVRTALYNALVQAALLAFPIGASLGNIATLAAFLPQSAPTVVAAVTDLYNNTVSGALDHAGDDMVGFRVAASLVRDFGAPFQLFPAIGPLPVTTIPGATTLQGVLDLARSRLLTGGTAPPTGGLGLYNHFVRPACDGTVAELADWFSVPLGIQPFLVEFGADPGPIGFCADATVQTLSFPSSLDPSDQTVDGQLQGGVLAPPQTPGGDPAGSQVIFPQPTVYDLHATGATFTSSGSADLGQTVSGADGKLSFQLDRGADQTQRAPSVAVSGTGQVGGFWADVEASITVDPFISIDLGAAQAATVTVKFRSPPVNQILEPGGTSHLCVDVTDGQQNVLPQLPVDWTLDGDGSLSDTTTSTDSLGTACVDYQHPAGIVAKGDTARVTATAFLAGATGSDAVVLTPRWADIALETKGASDAAFQPATNTTVTVQEGDQVQLRLTLTGPGATPSDPPLPLADDVAKVDIESGGGQFILDDGSLNTLVLPLLDANGQALVTWDPNGFTGEAKLRVSYPDSTVSSTPGVTATVTLQNKPIVVVSPGFTSVAPGGSATFSAIVSSTTNQAVTWTATGGTIDAGGTFTAGSTTGFFTVTATSTQDPTSKGTATVIVGTLNQSGTFDLVLMFTGTETTCDPSGCYPFGPTRTKLFSGDAIFPDINGNPVHYHGGYVLQFVDFGWQFYVTLGAGGGFTGPLVSDPNLAQFLSAISGSLGGGGMTWSVSESGGETISFNGTLTCQGLGC